MNRYQAYGLVIASGFPLRLPTAVGAPEPEIEFLKRERCFFLRHETFRRHPNGSSRLQHVRLRDGTDYLRWPKLGEFLIRRGGRQIIGRPLDGISHETFQAYLLTRALSFALLKLGIEPLHATAVAIGGKAVAFLGDCGYGKSTLAAACVKAGFPLVTDDLLVLKKTHGQLLAYPGVPRIKLMPSVAQRLLGFQVKGTRMNPFTSKLIIPLQPAQYAESPLPLHTIYALRFPQTPTRSRVAIRRLSAKTAWLELSAGTSNLVVRDPDRLKQQFAWACQLVQQVPVKSLSYPRNLPALPQVVQAIIADVLRR